MSPTALDFRNKGEETNTMQKYVALHRVGSGIKRSTQLTVRCPLMGAEINDSTIVYVHKMEDHEGSIDEHKTQ